jgi:zinc finger protein
VEAELFCPACEAQEFETRFERLEIPHFEEILQLTYLCEACGFRSTDLTITKQEEPARYELEVTTQEDLTTRVIRSASGHFEIPELDIRAEPGHAAEAFVTNAEGLLDRCESAIRTASRGSSNPQETQKADRLLERAERLRAVEETWTIVIEDPKGNSAILGEATRSLLTEEEIDELELSEPTEASEVVDP